MWLLREITIELVYIRPKEKPPLVLITGPVFTHTPKLTAYTAYLTAYDLVVFEYTFHVPPTFDFNTILESAFSTVR